MVAGFNGECLVVTDLSCQHQNRGYYLNERKETLQHLETTSVDKDDIYKNILTEKKKTLHFLSPGLFNKQGQSSYEERVCFTMEQNIPCSHFYSCETNDLLLG